MPGNRCHATIEAVTPSGVAEPNVPVFAPEEQGGNLWHISSSSAAAAEPDDS